jgi:hypothetical protein
MTTSARAHRYPRILLVMAFLPECFLTPSAPRGQDVSVGARNADAEDLEPADRQGFDQALG